MTFLAIALGAPLMPRTASATCNVIPSTVTPFRGALGTIDRPFAMPTDLVTLEVDPATKNNPLAVPLANVDGNSQIDGADLFVTLLFEPVTTFDYPSSAARHVVVLASNCDRIESWGRCAGGPKAGLPCESGATCGGTIACELPTKAAQCEQLLAPTDVVSCAEVPITSWLVRLGAEDQSDVVRFPFPDTDSLVGTAADGRTLAGPATIAVTLATSPLPCALAATPGQSEAPDTGRCAETGGLVACVDEIYARRGTSSAEPSDDNLHRKFPYFTALPKANDFRAHCRLSDFDGECLDEPGELRFALDRGGNALFPMDYLGVQRQAGKLPLARIMEMALAPSLSVSIPAPACPNQSVSFVQSFSLQGHQVSPLLSPRAVRSSGDADLLGSIDAEAGVVRFQRRGDDLMQCQGGGPDYDGAPCSCSEQCNGGVCGVGVCNGGGASGEPCPEGDGQCPGGQCGPSVFNLALLLAGGGIGSGTLPNSYVDLDIVDTVPLNGIIEDSGVIAFVTSERNLGTDRNGDGDITDSVITLRDRLEGQLAAIGDGGAGARAVAVIRNGLSREPAVATDGDLVAFLEPEALQGACTSQYDCDKNGDHDVADTILRAYRVHPGGGFDVLAGSGLDADAAPAIDGKPLRISDGLLFFRRLEWQGAKWTTWRVNGTWDSSIPNGDSNLCGASSDHRFVVFSSRGTNVMSSSDQNGTASDLFLRDRDLRSRSGRGWRVRRSHPDQPRGSFDNDRRLDRRRRPGHDRHRLSGIRVGRRQVRCLPEHVQCHRCR